MQKILTTKSYMLILFLSLILAGSCTRGYSQAGPADTLRLSVAEAEKMFLERNLLLLAQQYNIDAAKALIIQARLWNNPSINISQGVYNPVKKTYFDFTQYGGETAVQLQQLFLLAGKRNKQIQIARTNAQIEEYQFYDLLRTLKAQLRNDFYTIFYLLQSQKVYDQEISSLEKTAAVFEEQVKKGNIAPKELLRIKAFLFALNNELVDLKRQTVERQTDFNILLRTKDTFYIPQLDEQKVKTLDIQSIPLQALLDTAYNNRFDLKIAQANYRLSQQNYSLQKALAVPDVTLGLNYDKNGSYVHNFNALSMAIDLPFFNRNQGNIKSAQYQIQAYKTQLESQRKFLEGDVIRTYKKALENEKLYRSFDTKFADDFDKLIEQILINYQKRNIGLLEFIDFYDSYKQNKLQWNALQLNRINSYEDVNFSVGKNIFN